MENENRHVYEKSKNWDKKGGKNSFYYLQLITRQPTNNGNSTLEKRNNRIFFYLSQSRLKKFNRTYVSHCELFLPMCVLNVREIDPLRTLLSFLIGFNQKTIEHNLQ